MSRMLSLTMRQALNAQETGELPIFLLTVTHPQLESPILLSSDPTQRLSETPLVYGTHSRERDFMFLPMSFTIPDEKDDAPPATQLVIDNVDRELVNILRSTSTPAQVLIELVLASAPNAVEIEFPLFDLVGADYDAQQVSLSLALNGLATEPFPSGTFSPATFPGLF